MKLTYSTLQPWRCIVVTSADLRDAYCASATRLALTIYWLVTSDMRLNSSRQITPTLVFVGILNAIPSGLLFQSRSWVICSCGIPFFLRISSDWVKGPLRWWRRHTHVRPQRVAPLEASFGMWCWSDHRKCLWPPKFARCFQFQTPDVFRLQTICSPDVPLSPDVLFS